MATLVSPGVSVTVTDESNYSPNSLGTVAYILLATAQNKTAPGGTSIAAGTLSQNADKVYTITSQRDLVTTFGNPFFATTNSGAAINADEQNEYGLMAAYSLLGVSNTVYVQRANVDLGGLTGTTIRPVDNPATGTYWLDTSTTNWGIYQWDAFTQSFTEQSPIVITNPSLLVSNTTPNVTLGGIGSYAVNAYQSNNVLYYKGLSNTWNIVGSTQWQYDIPTITGSVLNPVIPSGGGTIDVNGTNITFTSGENLASIIATINGAGPDSNNVVATTNSVNQLILTGSALSSGQQITITGDTNVMQALGLHSGTFTVPQVQIAPYYNIPQWQGPVGGGESPPTGSVWQKTTTLGGGLSPVVNKYNATNVAWETQKVTEYPDVLTATFSLDPTAGGLNITQNSIFAQYNVKQDNITPSVYFWVRNASGPTIGTGTTTTPTYNNGQFNITVRPTVNSPSTTTYTVTVSQPSAFGFISAVSAAGIPNVSAKLATSGAMTLVHATGGDIIIYENDGYNVLGGVGLTAGTHNNITVDPSGSGNSIISNWVPLAYIPSSTQPYIDPADGTYWYYDSPAHVDIMINDGTNWKGYRTLAADIRGYNLQQTNVNGPIVSSSAPTAQDNGNSLVYGDLWLDTSDLENYPSIYRWQSVNAANQWVKIDLTDETSQNGIIFADARWSVNGTTDPSTDAMPSVASLALSNYLDLDAPDPTIHPRGMLLFNTRASGYNVKQFRFNYFNGTSFPDQSLPAQKNAWVSVSGYDAGNSPNFGRKAQRGVVVAALKSAIDSSTVLREEQHAFNLIACPGYPELIPNMVTLNDDRGDTAFIVGDTPMRLPATGTAIQAWAQNSNNAPTTGEDGLTITNPYVGIYYPSAQTNDLSGNAIVVPPSHVALRVISLSDNMSYQWFAPAGSRRGLIDNASSIGYVDADSGAYYPVGITQGLRDVMYTNSINPYTNLPGTGLLVYGQKTLSPTPSALDRINVARLVNYLRRQLSIITRPYLFEPNDSITRSGVKAVVSSMLNDLISKRGITDYLVVCDSTNNTPDRVDRNELWIDVAIEPTKAVEFIYIPIRLMASGAITSGLAAAEIAGKGA